MTRADDNAAVDDPQGNPRARQVERLISSLLRIGVTVSLIIVVVGLAMSFTHHPEYLRRPGSMGQVIASGRGFPHTLTTTWWGVVHLRGEGIVTLGLLLLIATPVMRVAIAILGFAYERDAMFIGFTTLVLALLIVSFLLGRVEG